MNKEIKHQLFFQHPPSIVWEYFTKEDLIEQWLMTTDFKPVVGHQFLFKTSAEKSIAF